MKVNIVEKMPYHSVTAVDMFKGNIRAALNGLSIVSREIQNSDLIYSAPPFVCG